MSLLCPVRGCASPLPWDTLACPNGHRFDRARSGYVNLLQPQDKKAAEPGDSREAVRARRRLVERGLAGPLHAIIRLFAGPGVLAAPVLDVGCGEGSLIGALGAPDAWGVDLSAAAVELAAKRWPQARWIAANADRVLPFADHAFGTILSITSRRNGPEFRRLLTPGGRLILGVPAAEDLAEVREILLDGAESRDRAPSAIRGIGLPVVMDQEVHYRRTLDRAALDDLLAATYRGARRREQERFASVDKLDVTFATRLLVFQQPADQGSAV